MNAPTKAAEIRAYIKTQSANEATFNPPAFADPAFVTWANRIALKVLNIPKSAGAHAITRAYFSDGTPSPEWVLAMNFALYLSAINKDHADRTQATLGEIK